MKIGLDATPMLGSRTGIGHYTANLIQGLAATENTVIATPFTFRSGTRPADLDERVRWRHRPVPARVLQASWNKSSFPPVEMLAGKVDLFHGTNFVLPPTLTATGVVTIHDLSYLKYPELVNAASLRYRTLVPRGLKRARGILTPTRAIADEVIDTYRLDGRLVTVTPLGVDRSWAAVKPFSSIELSNYGLPGSYLLAVGTLEPRKGLDILIQAYRQLISAKADVPPLVIVGPSGWGAELDLAGIDDGRVIFTGYIKYVDLQRIVAAASLFCFPSRYEGFGLPPLEALAAGVPVVATEIPTSVEVLGSFAQYCPTEDAPALAEAILLALGLDRPKSSIESARVHALSWTWDKCVEATLAAYQKALG